MTDRRARSRPAAATPGPRPVSLLAIASTAVVAAVAAIVLWLALVADTTVQNLRDEADRASLRAVYLLPPADRGDGSAASPARPGTPPGDDGAPTSAAMVQPARITLDVAPIPELIEDSASGPLPRIANDGRVPWQVYARPFDTADPRPRIAIVITDMGYAGGATQTAIQRLPGPVTLAFTPYARDLETWMRQARNAGHETMLMVPMEPDTYPRDDPGPHTLLTSLEPAANLQRLEWVLGRGTGYVGVLDTMGSRFTMAEGVLTPVLEALANRGLLFLDSRSAPRSLVGMVADDVGLARVINDRIVDGVTERDVIDLRLQELEDIARNRGIAVGLASPYPVTFERLAAWIPGLAERGIALAPVSAIADRQLPR